jgi:hypothetical protein
MNNGERYTQPGEGLGQVELEINVVQFFDPKIVLEKGVISFGWKRRCLVLVVNFYVCLGKVMVSMRRGGSGVL